MKISLVIPAHNEEKYIEDCLRSVLKNSQGLHEITVVNNASTDNTSGIVKKFKEVRLVIEESKGTNKARQKGFEESVGDVIAFLDADSRMPENWVERITEAFEKDPELACYSGPCFYYDVPKGANTLIWFYWRVCARTAYFFTRYMVLGGNFAAKRETIEAMGGFNKDIAFYGDDTDTARRIHKLGKVRFDQNFYIYTSARRLRRDGIVTTNSKYVINFLSQVLRSKSFTDKYNDIR